MFNLPTPKVERFNPKSTYPLIKSMTHEESINRNFGFKRNRVSGSWLSSSLATAEATLSPVEYGNFVTHVQKYLSFPAGRGAKYDTVANWSKLRQYQKDGVKRLVENKATLLGDEMGLGKTVQVAIALEVLANSCSSAIIVPNHLYTNWCEELAKWTSSVVVNGCRTLNAVDGWIISKGVTIVVPFSQIHKIKKLEVDILVVDEAHYLTNPEARRTLAVASIEAPRRWLLSGTAFKNHPLELYSLLNILRVSDFFGGSRSGFALGFNLADLVKDEPKPTGFRVRRFAKKLPPRLVPKKMSTIDLNKFGALISEVFYLRRNKSEYLDLPDKVRRHLKLTKATGVNKKEARDFKAMVGETTRLDIEHVAEISPLRIASACKLVGSSEFKEYVEGLTEKTVFFTYHNEVTKDLRKVLKEKGKTVYEVTRDTADAGVEVRKFNEADNDGAVIIVSIRKGSTGLTLTSSARVVMIELDWTVAELSQCEDRVHRFGQTKGVTVDYLTTEGGVDDYVISKLIQKEHHESILK